MTAASPVRVRPALDVESALGIVRLHGLRASSARRLVLEALFAAEGPVPAEALAAGLDGRLPASDLASTYRNLETLEELGLVRHLHLGHGPALFALVRDGDEEYLLCERCGAVQAVDTEELDDVRAEIAGRFGHQVRFTHFPLAGLCAGCAS